MTVHQTEENTHLAALAGLLHDIGKFAQRAGWRTGKHADVGGEFVSAYVPEKWREHLYPVMGHHDRPLVGHATKVVSLADRLSAAEREDADTAAARQLVSILCRVGEKDQRPGEKVWPLTPLELTEEALFPGDPLAHEQEDQAYSALWDGFVAAVETLPAEDLPTYLEGFYYALRRFTWCVPGAYYWSVPDVSLFDHSRTTAALAACLAGVAEERLDDLIKHERRDEPLVLLVGGDVSGVQDFIYTITARGAARGLRGRSFYLEMLTEAVVRYLLLQLGLPVTNLIYAVGGHLYFLAPLEAEEQLVQLQAGVSRKLLAHHGGDLYLALGWTAASAKDFDREHFNKQWREVSEAMNAAKRQRFSELDSEDLLVEEVFGPIGEGGDDTSECQVCHYEGSDVVSEDENDEEARRACRFCRSLEELGRDLRDAGYLLLGEVEPAATTRAGYAEALQAFGMAVGILDSDGSSVLRLPDDVRRATLLATRDLGEVGVLARHLADRCGCSVAPGTRYAVNVTPRVSEEDTKTTAFERYAKDLTSWELPDAGDVKEFGLLQEQAQGVHQLGVLRMDVDDLGDLFQWGMRGEGTLSRMASLSFALSLFFEGWVGELCRAANATDTDVVYPIYSGGDDLFIVGAWDALPGLADTIRQDLARFAAGNRGIHISGGLTLHGGKYPLYQAARDAEEALDEAKDLERPEEPDHHKDGFHFLGVTFPWERFDDLVREKDRLVHLVAPPPEGLGAKRELLRTLLRLYVRYAEAVHTRGKPTWGPWMWLGAYALKRMETRYRNNQEAQEEIKRFREALKEDGFRYIETLGPAARWAELLMRKE